jgi:hypothetical protein
MCRCRPCALGHRDRREKRGRRENGLECGAIGTCETLVGGGRDQDLRVRRRVGCCRRGCWRRRGSGFRSLRRRRKKQRCEERGRGREEGRRTSEIQWTGILLSTFLNLRNFVRKFCPISPRAFHPNLALFGTPSFILTLPRPLSSARSPSPSRRFRISRLPSPAQPHRSQPPFHPPTHSQSILHYSLPQSRRLSGNPSPGRSFLMQVRAAARSSSCASQTLLLETSFLHQSWASRQCLTKISDSSAEHSIFYILHSRNRHLFTIPMVQRPFKAPSLHSQG